MIKVIEKKTICGDILKSYQLTQGDSFKFRATQKSASNNSLIDKITFKVSREDYNKLFEKDFELQDDGNYILFVESSDTESWPAGHDYKTEIEVTFIDGSVDTVEKASLVVEPQIKDN